MGRQLSLLSCALLAASPIVAHAATDLFDWEEIQLSDSGLQSLKARGLHGTLPRAANASCKVFPGDADWPADSQWSAFNETVEGALIKSVPHASVCYEGPYYDEAECATITANWTTNSYIHDDDPIEMLSPVYQGLTCQPPTLYEGGINSGNCTLGGFPAYAVAVTNVKQIQASVKFAHENGLRFVVKNTGHDFSGKSGGAGALSVWTKHLKGITYEENYVDEGTGYSGPAFKAGSGVRAWEIYQAAHEHGKVVVGGEGQTVGVMGGYIQGGGHSPLSSMYGMAADQVLSMNVVLANGTFVTASSTENTDLFWALKGGGGATYGIVTSLVVKAWPDMPCTASKLSWTSANMTNETFWAGVRSYLSYFPEHADAQQTYSYWFIIQQGGGVKQFLMQPFFAPNKTLAQTQALLDPWFADLKALGIAITPRTTHYERFHDAWLAEFPLEVVQKTHVGTGSRLWPRRNWDDEATFNATFDSVRWSSQQGNTIVGFNMAPRLHPSNAPNSVNPAWRDNLMFALQSVNWLNNSTRDYIMERRTWFNNVAMQRWIDASPGAGSYLAESNRMEAGWKQSFYGEYYDRLLEIKKAMDPNELFWAATAVGSDAWAVESVDGLPNENGRLCRTGA